jgi:hypothetical protein
MAKPLAAPDANSKAAMTDENKILVQLYLDVQEFSGAMASYVAIDSQEDFQELLGCVAEAKEILARFKGTTTTSDVV